MYYWIISGFLFCPSPLSLNLGKAPTILNDTNACNTSWILVFSLKILRTSIMSFLEKSDEHVPCTIVLKMEAHYFPTPTISITHQLFAELIPWVFSTIPSFKCIQTIQVGIIRMFEQYQERLSAVVGAKRAKKVVNEALVLMTLGGNDFVITPRSRQFTVPDFSLSTEKFLYMVMNTLLFCLYFSLLCPLSLSSMFGTFLFILLYACYLQV